jgi:hypothetical protein
MQQIAPYVQSPRIYKCPSDSISQYSYFLSARAAYLETDDFAPISAPRLAFADKFVLTGDTGGFADEDADKDDYTQNCVGGPDNGTPAIKCSSTTDGRTFFSRMVTPSASATSTPV